jgi:hypothetical protein
MKSGTLQRIVMPIVTSLTRKTDTGLHAGDLELTPIAKEAPVDQFPASAKGAM